MWLSFPSIDRVPARGRMAATSLAALIALGCPSVEEKSYEMHQPIAMGPWIFVVSGTNDRTEKQGIRLRKILVTFELENYQERHEKPFDDFLNGRTKGSPMTHPKLQLVTEAGKKFDGWLKPKSGGSMRSRRWEAAFELVDFSLRESASDTAKRYLDMHPGDFRLVIENPDRREGQPREVTLQLE